MFDTFSFKKFDFILVALVVALNFCGLMAIHYAAPELYHRQLAGLCIGLAAMLLCAIIDYHFVLKLHWVWYALGIALLVLVLFVGTTGGGAQRWISLFGVTFQPSEAEKLLLILFFAQFIAVYRRQMHLAIHLPACLVLALVPLYLIYREPDLSTALMIMAIFCVLMYVGGLEWPIVAAVLAVAVPSFVWLIYQATQGDGGILSPYQQARILAWLHPEDYADTTAYQTVNSMMAIGTGGKFGKGVSEMNSLLKTGFIAESQTDFIYTVIGETFGFVGSCAVLLLISLITIKCFLIAARARDTQGRIIAAGMGAWIGLQSFVNIGVATGLLPNTGLPLPFVSYGLTSLVSLYAGVGFALNVQMQV